FFPGGVPGAWSEEPGAAETLSRLLDDLFVQHQLSGRLDLLKWLGAAAPDVVLSKDDTTVVQLLFPGGAPGPWAGQGSTEIVRVLLGSAAGRRELRARQKVVAQLVRVMVDADGDPTMDDHPLDATASRREVLDGRTLEQWVRAALDDPELREVLV